MELLKNKEPELKKTCLIVEPEEFEGLKTQIDEMIQIALDNGLVGLSANQVGITKRLFIVNVNAYEEKTPEFAVFVNPKVKPIQKHGKSWGWERCGSISGWMFLVERWNRVEVSGQTIAGEPILPIELDKTLGIIFQHEQNHLNGILISDKARERRRINGK